MAIGKLCRLFCVLVWIWVLFPGCSSSGDGNNDESVLPGYQTYTTPGSDLLLQIPDTLDVSQNDIEDIHYFADQVPHCYTTNGESINIVLAEACILYDMFYVFPQYFPQNLNNILTVKAYVERLQTYDPFTFYISSEDYSDMASYYNGDSAFIGFVTECDGETVTNQTPLLITDIFPHTRAWIDGLQIGDKIIKIDAISLEGMNLDDIFRLFPKYEEETVEITVERDEVEITVYTAAEENIGLLLFEDIIYLNARSFTAVTEEEMRADYEELQIEAGKTIDKLILDLRNNGGGSYNGALMLVDYLINKDNGSYPILSVYGPAIEEETEYLGGFSEFNIGNFEKTNFVLLVDENSASAAEVVAAALKYYGTATLVGETTYGKGTGQRILELIDGSGVWIPSFYIIPPSGISYNEIGISPDYPINAQVTSFDDDPMLEAAIEYLNTGSITNVAASQILKEKTNFLSDKLINLPKQMFPKNIRSGGYF